ncbi:hypothetical protein BpHYR1_031614 [Brachionus plicatilis]|uniref:Uncharacterized protein n=1 Tax=Brachionus plicatilis TaxID=10195 RepID=A0A3M7SJ40_BRAPC|nr:hypothetical protein BpHYR1_031614 [Brachionus plicatilis]
MPNARNSSAVARNRNSSRESSNENISKGDLKSKKYLNVKSYESYKKWTYYITFLNRSLSWISITQKFYENCSFFNDFNVMEEDYSSKTDFNAIFDAALSGLTERNNKFI